MTSRRAKDRASRLRRFHDADDEYRETSNPEAAAERYRALRDKDVRESDFCAGYEELTGRRQDYRQRVRGNIRKYFTGWRESEKVE